MLDVAIVGGGIGGLALAAGLARKGYKAQLYEAAPALRTSTGTVVAFGNNAFGALADLHPDIVPQVKERGVQVQRMSRYVRLTKDAPVEEIAGPSMGDLYNVRWSEVQHVLASLVPPDEVQCNHRTTGYTEHAEDGYATVHFKDQPDVSARLVIAADGIRSALRAAMIPNDPGPRHTCPSQQSKRTHETIIMNSNHEGYLGHMYWNALLYNPNGSVANVHAPGETQAWVNSPSPGDYTTLAVLMDAGGGYTSWQVQVVFPEPDWTPGGQPDGMSTILGASYRPESKARVVKMLQDLGYEQPLKAVQATPEQDILERAIRDRIPLDELGGRMSSPGGRVVLLGDSAHAMHPGPGQGARSAIEDAHTMMMSLEGQRGELAKAGWDITPLQIDGSRDKVANGGSKNNRAGAGAADKEAVRAAVRAYEEARLARVCCIQRMSAEICGSDAIKQAVRPQGLDIPQRMQRMGEFHNWLSQYPNKAQGDPDSVYFKPEQIKRAATLKV